MCHAASTGVHLDMPFSAAKLPGRYPATENVGGMCRLQTALPPPLSPLVLPWAPPLAPPPACCP